LAARKRALFREMFNPTFVPGIVSLLYDLRGRGYRLELVTGSARSVVDKAPLPMHFFWDSTSGSGGGRMVNGGQWVVDRGYWIVDGLQSVVVPDWQISSHRIERVFYFYYTTKSLTLLHLFW
jgi:hypothetical protein